jgi:hypothetical protein
MRNAIANLLMAIGTRMVRQAFHMQGLGRGVDVFLVPKLPPTFGQEIFDALLASAFAEEPQKHLH